MNTSRHTEVNVLGYRIDHVRTDAERAPEPARRGLEHWREVLCPESGGVLARFASRAEAERYIIDRELEGARRAAERVLA
jgi:hypothetical protein